ncbi:PelD GGDEF domain-containing protein [Aquifex sp.]
MKHFFSPSLLVGLVLALYYGLPSSLLFLLIITILSYFLYPSLPYKELLWHLLVFLVASEFHYYWQKRVREVELEKEYLEEQISLLRKELFLLKLSHDQLELNYVLKPYSLRRILEELKERLLKTEDEKSLMDFFLKILLQNFQVYKAVVFRYRNGNLETLALLGNEEPKTDDILLKKSLEEESSVYLTPKVLEHIQDHLIHYVAVIREEVEGEVYLLAISDILFVNLNEEVLNYIYIILSYITEDLVFARKLRRVYANQHIPCNFNFIKELYKMAELYKKLGIESSLVFFSFEKLPETYPYDLENTIRKLDMLCILHERKLVIFLLPFTSILGAKSFSERIQKQFPALKFLQIKRVEEENLNEYLGQVVKDAS